MVIVFIKFLDRENVKRISKELLTNYKLKVYIILIKANFR